ncbi:hypothetical protein DFH27DRAFT_650781 [Peziza echinospora]|nr:hypothetical protein DFH27DRAFT_650781 [Peziza echinospora]
MAPVKISNLPDTFSGFDIVVSISEEAINGQLLKLYTTALEERMIPPSKLKSFKPLPPTKYLINHQFSLHLINKAKSTPENVVYRTTGIDGFIHCPKVRFRPEEYDSANGNAMDKYKKAYLEIKFKKDETTGADSIIKYLDQDTAEVETVVLNDCTMMWGVKIARKDVEDVMRDIIDPAHNSSSPAAAGKQVTEKLMHYVDSQIYTVSTIFCLFEEKSMKDSFLLLDAQRKPILNSALSDARNQVSLFFGEMTDQWKQNKGTPYATTENPYILGYGISQKRVDIKDIGGEGAETAAKNTPEYFKPKQVAMSVTPGEVKAEWMCTSGSLNYCLLTHRDTPEGHEVVDIAEEDLNAGIITKNFFDVTKTMGRTLDPQGNVQGHDGIMAFSKGIFSGLWLRSIAENLLLDPSSASYKALIATGLQKQTHEVAITLGTSQSTQTASGGWELKRAWKTGMMEPPDGQMKVGPGDKRVFVLGDCRVNVTYTSDTQSITSIKDGITHARRLFFDIEYENKWDYVFQYKSWLANAANNPDDSNDWLKKRVRGFTESDFTAADRWQFVTTCALSLRTKSLIRVVMKAGAVGKWVVDVDEGASKNPLKKNTTLIWTKGSADSGDYGNFQELKNFHSYTFEPDSEMVKAALIGWSKSEKDIIGDKVLEAFNGLTTTIIMPAGDVFTFAGLDSDDTGNVYTQVNFANDGGFEIVKGKA